MEKEQAREAFSSLVRSPDTEVDLIEAALLIAAECDEDVDVDYYIRVMDTLAESFENRHRQNRSLGISISSLCDFIHETEGFSGNVNNYYDTANSYLNRVIDTRVGIPITLALIHIGIGTRLSLPVGGVNFPGHFLVRYGLDKRVIVDPFTGRSLSDTDCANLLQQVTRRRVKLEPELLEFADTRDILTRMLDNLKQIYWRNEVWNEAQACIERQLLLQPSASEFMVQLGAVFEMKGDLDLAEKTYVDVLQNATEPQLRDVVSKRLLGMTPRTPTVH